MILGINYANDRFMKAQKLNTWSMLHKGKVDKVIEYNPSMLSPEFVSKNQRVLSQKRGGGYWIWKPYILQQALNEINNNDYLFYCDSGAVVIDSVSKLVDALEESRQDVMTFELGPEKLWSKRDAFIVMECDTPKFTETSQRLATYILIKKNENTEKLIEEFLHFATDFNIITDDPNTMGLPNYEGFIENRHDQTIWSLLTKKHGYLPFRDPSQFGLKHKVGEDVVKRSNYPIIIDSHRNANLSTWTSYILYRRFFWFINFIERIRKTIKRKIIKQ